MKHLPTSPKEIDLHLHAGQEREVTMDRLVQTFIDQGVTFLGLLDHSELYEMGDQNLKDKLGRLVYHSSLKGLADFCSEIETVRRAHAHDASIFKGLELPEWEMLRVDHAFFKQADFLGCHMNTSCHDPNYRHFTRISCGEHLAERAEQLLSICRPIGKPAVLFHPFHRRLQELRSRIESGGVVNSEDVFTEEDIETFLDRVAVEHLYIELNFGDLYTASTHPGLLKLLGRTCRRLKEGGISFSLGSDYHRTPEEFPDPTELIRSLGIRLEDLSLIYELADILRPYPGH